jgi:hypothetical protein
MSWELALIIGLFIWASFAIWVLSMGKAAGMDPRKDIP